MNRLLVVFFLILPGWLSAAGQDSRVNQLLDRVAKQERGLVARLGAHSPLVETYIQEVPADPAAEHWPNRDHYFLGRIRMRDELEYTPLVARSEPIKRTRFGLFKSRSILFNAVGFAQMILVDSKDFSRQSYRFEYVRREFLGEVRCFVFDVFPLKEGETGRFIGRIWVEDQGYNVVRFNGTYAKSSSSRLFFHFDSWRLYMGPGEWMPAAVYVEETGPRKGGAFVPSFKAQTRIWGYQPAKSNRLEELTQILIDSETAIQDDDSGGDISPLSSQRLWERQAEENVIDRLLKSGLLAPDSEVDEVLNTVVHNLVASNNLAVEPHCRVLLTTPLESFTVGNTIVMSRGLIDVLPDEASLAMVLAGELAHIVLGHRTNTQFAFSDQTMLKDEDLLERFRFARSDAEVAAASKKAVEILGQSPYQDKLANAGLFLKALARRAPQFPNLIRANLGNQLTKAESQDNMRQLIEKAPELQEDSLDQIAALPLGSRVKLDPWTSRITLIKTEALALKTGRDKLPFEVTPFQIRLSRPRATKATTATVVDK